MTSLTGIATVCLDDRPDLHVRNLPVCETELEQHDEDNRTGIRTTTPWDGKVQLRHPRRRRLDPTGGTVRRLAAALVGLLLTEDNLPSYHRMIAEHVNLDGRVGVWLGRWTAEEMRHSTVIRDYLVVTRGVDRTTRHRPHPQRDDRVQSRFRVIVCLSTAKACYWRSPGLPRACLPGLPAQRPGPGRDRIHRAPPATPRRLRRTLHMLFYRNIIDSALDLAPDATMAADLMESCRRS